MKSSRMSIRTLSMLLMGAASAVILSLQLTFFIQVSILSRKDVAEYAERMAVQTRDSVQSLCSSASSISSNVSRSRYVQDFLTQTDGYERYKLYHFVNDYVLSLTQSAGSVAGVCIYDDSCELKYYTDLGSFGRPSAEALDIAGYLSDLDTGVLFLPSSGKEPYLICCTPVLGTRFDQYSRQKLGFTAVLIGMDQFSALLWSDDTHRVYMENQALQNIYPPESEGGGTARDRSFSFHLPIAGTGGWELCCDVDVSRRQEGYLTTLYTALTIIVISALLMAAYSYLIRRRITQPILRLQGELSILHEKGLHTKLSGKYPGEVQTIADSVNILIDNLYDLAKQIVQEQQKTYEIELREEQTNLYALQTQINPHFLFNTLQCLAGIAAAHDEPEVVGVSLSMSSILRYAVSNDHPTITLCDELAIAGEYLKIMEVRFTGRFSWSIQRDQELDCPCLKMLLQPLIENAITHGLENSYQDGRVEILCSRSGSSVFVDIHDNGAGIPPEKLAVLRRTLKEPAPAHMHAGHIGMANVQHRIQMVFGPEYGIEILYSGPEGTGVRMCLPAGEEKSAPKQPKNSDK